VKEVCVKSVAGVEVDDGVETADEVETADPVRDAPVYQSRV